MKHLTIAVSTQSIIAFNGFCMILRQLRDYSVTFQQVAPSDITNDPDSLEDCDFLVCDPLTISGSQLDLIRNVKGRDFPVIALYHCALPVDMVKSFDGAISIYDNDKTILATVLSVLNLPGTEDSQRDLTSREKDIIVGVVKGLSNKEIAAELNVSVNTVMTHRRNIASKLQIHSAAGLTIYALVSKLVKLEDIAGEVSI